MKPGKKKQFFSYRRLKFLNIVQHRPFTIVMPFLALIKKPGHYKCFPKAQE